jgi:hypothetical protein
VNYPGAGVLCHDLRVDICWSDVYNRHLEIPSPPSPHHNINSQNTMQSLIALTTLLTLAYAFPMPTPTPEPVAALPTVQLRTLGPSTIHFTASSQSPSTNGHIITLVLDTVLSSLEQDPLFLQGIEVVETEGSENVVCKANVNHASKEVVVKSGDGMVMLGQRGSVVQVTGLSCRVQEGSV